MSVDKVKVIQDALPADLSETRGEELGKRLVKRCSFLPTVSEIVEEWHIMCREKPIQNHFSWEHPAKPNRAMLQRIREIRETVASGHRFPEPPLTQDVIDFAHQFFPEMSDTLIRRNWQEITSCQLENRKEEQTNSRYRTVMNLSQNGVIELLMRKR